MNPAEQASAALYEIENLNRIESPYRHLSPVAKLLMTLVYIGIVMSFGKYDITGLFVMILFPVTGYQLAGIPVSACFYRMRYILPLICAVGLLNPLFDRTAVQITSSLSISGGWISMITLCMKGIFAVMASFLLIASTPIEEICSAMRRLHIPKIIVSLILLTYRYIHVMLRETAVMTDAYLLRCPDHKGVHISAWGSFLGSLLLRSSDRAQQLYESMLLRGYHGEYPVSDPKTDIRKSAAVLLIVTMLMFAARIYNIPALIGRMFVR